MAEAFGVVTGIITILVLAGKVATRVNSVIDAPPHIMQALNEAKMFRDQLILLQSLIDQRATEPETSQQDVFGQLGTEALERCLQGSIVSFTLLEKELDGLVGEDGEIGVGDIGKWVRREAEIISISKDIQNHKLTLNTTLTILN